MTDLHIRFKTIGELVGSADLDEGSDNGQNLEQRFLEHYGLHEQPFGVTPDPWFLYLGPKHRDALASLTYGTELNRGFLTLIAQPGMGKTSLLFKFLEHLRNKARVAFLYQTDGDSHDLMRQLLADLNLDGRGKDLLEMRSILNQFLTEEMHAGRRFILLIDEAQNLDEKVLESIRLLSNFETPCMKLMQIVLSGQPQLAERLSKPSMTQLRQRVSLSIRIEPLTCDEVNAYVDHRLWVAGYKGSPLFSTGAKALVADKSKGIPRNINNICFCAMSLGWTTNARIISREIVCDVLSDFEPRSLNEKREFSPKFAVSPSKLCH
jgi:type II secretory pathway predicted ATPase ExeA